MKSEDFIIMPIPTQNYAAVCALIGVLNGVSLPAPGNAPLPGKSNVADQSKSVTSSNSTTEAYGVASDESLLGLPEQTSDTTSSADDSGEIDAHGHPWSADLHASTKGKTKEGLWRMKPGASRPDPLPGYPADTDTGTSSATDTPSATSPAATEPASAPTATSTEAGEDDEFAAFRAASASSDQTDAAAAASVPARTYSDADLGALCNQAATKLGDPSPIKEIIASYTPEGQVAHSRNIPEDKRAAFVGEVETKAGISFAG